MNDALYQIGIGIGIVLGLLGLVAFLWTLRSRQYEDLDGAAERILLGDDDDGAKAEPDAVSAEADGADSRDARERDPS